MKGSPQSWLVPSHIDRQGPEVHRILCHGTSSLPDHEQSFGGGTGMIRVVEHRLEIVLNLIIDKGSQVGAAAHRLSPRQCLFQIHPSSRWRKKGDTAQTPVCSGEGIPCIYLGPPITGVKIPDASSCGRLG